ncbi:MAG TPA: glycosyltransferase family 39 protein, partial [Candidatus Hydrogenedentes bacterium]|nr:glycosyltransferase family 39 protein [Candidatus Hydrogenedentota bacterium]
IDPVLVCFWAMAMYTFHRAVAGEKSMWTLTGLALGLGTLSKYTMLVLALSFLAYLAICDRRWLRTLWPWLAMVITLLCLSGVIYWNGQHDWVSIRHTASIGAEGTRSFGKCIGGFFEYLGGQAGATSPILFFFYLWAIWHCARRFRVNKDAAYLFLCFAVLFGFYLFIALTRKANVNWPICAYTACVVAFGWIWTEQPRSLKARRWLTAAIVLGCIIGLAARSTGLIYLAGLPIDPDKDPTNKLRGGREIGQALSKYIIDPKLGPFPFSNRYQMTAWTAFYTKGHPRAYCINPGDRRMNQYDLWGGWPELKGRDGLFVTGGDAIKAQLWIEGMVQFGAFTKGEVLEIVEVKRANTIIDRYSISRLYNYSGADQTPSTTKY